MVVNIQFSSYYKKVTTHVLLFSLIPIIILSSLFYIDKIEVETNSLKNNLLETSELNAKNISNTIANKKKDIFEIANQELIITSTKQLKSSDNNLENKFSARMKVEKIINEFLESNPEINGIIITNTKDGKILFSTEIKNLEIKLHETKFFQEAINGEIGMSKVFSSKNIIKKKFGGFNENISTFLISVPIKGEVGIEGILTARIDIFKIGSDEIPQIEKFRTADTYFIDSDGYFLSEPIFSNKAKDMKSFGNIPESKLRTIELDTKKISKNFQESINKKTIVNLDGYKNYVGHVVIGAITPIDGTKWKYISEVEKNEAFKEINILQILLTSFILMIILSILGGTLYFSKGLTKPINTLEKAAKKIAKGNLDTNIKINSKDELGQLAKSFEQMVENLKKTTDVEAQLALQKNLRKAMDDSSIVTIMNPDGIITHVNDKFCEISKYSKEEIVGSNLLMLRSTVHPIEYYDELWNTISKGNVWRGQICNRAKDGNLFWNKVTIIPFKDKNGKVLEHIAIRHDITEQKENEIKSQKALEELQKSNIIIENQSKKIIKQEKLAVVGELAARLSHDIRNPLSIIRVSLENLKMIYGETETEIKHFERVERAIDRIAHQIEDVLGFVRKEPIKFEKAMMSDIIADALDSVNIPDRIYFEILKNNFEFFCDRKRLVVAITNLILNGIQAITGKGTIKIDCMETEEDVIIKINDSGRGIPTNVIDDIFEPLFTTKQQGTGLGLASVKSIIQGHGGTISVTSPPTIFTIILPKKNESKETK